MIETSASTESASPTLAGCMRIGLSTSLNRTQAVAVNSQNAIIASVAIDWHGPVDEGIRAVLPELLHTIPVSQVSSVMLASTVLDELLHSDGHLARVGVLRIGLTTSAVPPLSGWPASVSSRVTGPRALVAGGADVDGEPIAALDRDAVTRFAESCVAEVDAVAISSVFSPISAAHELDAAKLIARVLGTDTPITLSHTVGGFGLLERENATIISSSLSLAGPKLITSVRQVLHELGLSADLFLAQNDGSLLGADAAGATPVRVLDSRMAAAVRGAGLLTGTDDAIVLDFDEAVPRAGVLANGEVALDYERSSFAGVRVIQDLPLGFDSPRNARSVDGLRRYARDAPVIAVGDVTANLVDASMTVPDRAEFAAAVGAASGFVSSAVWAFVDAEGDGDALVTASRQRAVEEAILAGADPSATRVISVLETPITYMAGEPRRLFVRAAGPPFSNARDYTHHPDERNQP